MTEPMSVTSERTAGGLRVAVDSDAVDELEIEIEVSLPDRAGGNETIRRVLETYAENMLIFVQKNLDYGSSFSNAPKIESILKHGEVREEEIGPLMARQIFYRGFLDKISRFYTVYIDDNNATVDETSIDTLLDLGNYAIMLASELRARGGEKQ